MDSLSKAYKAAHSLADFYTRINKTSYTQEDKEAIDGYYAAFTHQQKSNIVDTVPREMYLEVANNIIQNAIKAIGDEYDIQSEVEGKTISEVETLLKTKFKTTPEEYNSIYSSAVGDGVADAIKQIQLTQSYLAQTNVLFDYMTKNIKELDEFAKADSDTIGMVGFAVDYISELLGGSSLKSIDESPVQL